MITNSSPGYTKELMFIGEVFSVELPPSNAPIKSLFYVKLQFRATHSQSQLRTDQISSCESLIDLLLSCYTFCSGLLISYINSMFSLVMVAGLCLETRSSMENNVYCVQNFRSVVRIRRSTPSFKK